MKNCTKKLVSLVLVAAMSLTMSVPGFAAEKDTIHNKNSIKSEETVKIGAATYYYENNNNHRICIGAYPSGLLDIAYIDESNPDILYYENIKSNSFLQTSNDIIKDSENSIKNSNTINLKNIASDVISNKIQLKQMSLENFKNRALLNSSLYRSGKSDAQLIGENLARTYGNQYSNKLIGSRYDKGLNAKLYEAMYFNIYDAVVQDFFFDVGTTLAVAAVTLSLTVSVAKSLLGSAIKLVKGEYTISKGTGVHKYYAEVIYYKDVRIGSQSPYRASREIDFTPYVCNSEGTVILNKTKDFADDDFNDNGQLLRKGIELY
ncbi:hypothetical protein [Caproiciproducens galactitolivorans]|uniref:Uncharacterized protein n=1 Tax=Caproiciproducens galactitolivorans TaxID=642589 RepID=A0ABT4BWP5_9FIRM|nr:hypothetical protein [Caproiciproducens galactitolivorans]MCY1715319.1 hypothetical protein [Caproiciproducens galactitolivorans]